MALITLSSALIILYFFAKTRNLGILSLVPVPVMLIGWFYGMKPAVTVALFFALFTVFSSTAIIHGETKQYLYIGSVMSGASFVLIGFIVGKLKDLTEQKKAAVTRIRSLANDLKRSNLELEQFAYIASHDLLEPLRMVSNYVQLLEKRNKDKLDSDSKEFIGFAVDGAKRMKRLIDDLLTHSRVSTKGRPFEPVECEKVFEAAIKNLEFAIQDKKANVTHDPLPRVTADEGQLVQLFQNLIGNAIKFCKERAPEVHVSAVRQKRSSMDRQGGMIAEIRTRNDEFDWLFSVRDNGIGIAPMYFERIFKIFQRLHAREEYDGTGIGLAVCMKIVERHGGRIWVESKEGEGAVFLFTIPEK